MSASTDPTSEFQEQLAATCRTVVGDELRSITYFDEERTAKVYLREDLQWNDDVGYAENERQGFRSQSVYDESELGEYRATIRMFDGGYLTRVIAGDHGAYVTTDRMEIDRFEELAEALSETLEEAN